MILNKKAITTQSKYFNFVYFINIKSKIKTKSIEAIKKISKKEALFYCYLKFKIEIEKKQQQNYIIFCCC